MLVRMVRTDRSVTSDVLKNSVCAKCYQAALAKEMKMNRTDMNTENRNTVKNNRVRSSMDFSLKEQKENNAIRHTT